MRNRVWPLLVALAVAEVGGFAAAGDVRINEFLAANHGGLRDEDGDTSDWIELYNSGPASVNLGGWYLTDKVTEPSKWRFPSYALQPNSYFIVFASGKDRTNAAAPLHTNFKLSAGGSYVGLVEPDGATVASEFVYLTQYSDISYGCNPTNPAMSGYCAYSTPDAPNAPTGFGFGPAVDFSVSSGAFQEAFSVALSASDTNAVIRYFIVTNAVSAALTNVPDLACPIYSHPITVNNSVEIRARSFPVQGGCFPGPLHSESYLKVSSPLTSGVPLVIFYNYGAGAVPDKTHGAVSMLVFAPSNGVSSTLNAPALATRAFYHLHGDSTRYDAKPNLRVKTVDENGGSNDQPLLGMPADSDWIFYAPDIYDKSALHNPMAHELFTEMGHYTSRTRYAEVYMTTTASSVPTAITPSDYYGIYVIEEKIRVRPDRVDINRLENSDTNAPDLTGGYLMSIDREGKTDANGNPIPELSVAGVTMYCLDPDYYTLAYTQAVQMQYVASYFNAFYSALYSPQWLDPTHGYAPFIDKSSWIDYHLSQFLVFNVDMLRLSAYFNKPRSGPLVQGPLWDFDRSFGTGAGGDLRGFNPSVWESQEMDGGTAPFTAGGTYNNPWYARLFTDPDFFQAWIDRYQELRQSVFSLSNLTYQINTFANQLSKVAAHDASRWTGSGQSDTSPRSGPVTGDNWTYTFPRPGTYQGEVNFARLWFTNRVHFLDTNFVAQPTLSQNGGTIQPGFTLTLALPAADGGAHIYYTLDGSDPRASGGGVSVSAHLASGPAAIVLASNATVVARSWNPAHAYFHGSGCPPLGSPWSGPITASFYIPPAFKSVTALPNGQVLIQGSFQPGSPCWVETSTNLSDWSPLTSFMNAAGVFQFTGSSTTNGTQLFYRAWQ